MNEDYLWDRTGEPDPEIQQLEEVLGTLRYQPQQLELPAGIRPERKRSYFPRIAIAAAVALLILGAGLWVRVHRSQTPGQRETVVRRPPQNEVSPPVTAGSPTTGSQQLAGGVDKVDERAAGGIHNSNRTLRPHKNSLARNARSRPAPVRPPADLTAEQREQVVAAKEQLMLALRVASAKLNLAQRKSQGPPASSTIRNQHKVG